MVQVGRETEGVGNTQHEKTELGTAAAAFSISQNGDFLTTPEISEMNTQVQHLPRILSCPVGWRVCMHVAPTAPFDPSQFLLDLCLSYFRAWDFVGSKVGLQVLPP